MANTCAVTVMVFEVTLLIFQGCHGPKTLLHNGRSDPRDTGSSMSRLCVSQGVTAPRWGCVKRCREAWPPAGGAGVLQGMRS